MTHPCAPRFIPTPVGNTVISRVEAPCIAVHPHARGEHSMHFWRVSSHRGSSPRPWGTHNRSRSPQAVWRFIPTPVGNTPAVPRRGNSRPVHPHARGEHIKQPHYGKRLAGSSPRPWGTRARPRRCRPGRRFIPTPVGNTPETISPTCGPTVHPHARGEHNCMSTLAANDAGSSPRPWGTPDDADEP